MFLLWPRLRSAMPHRELEVIVGAGVHFTQLTKSMYMDLVGQRGLEKY